IPPRPKGMKHPGVSEPYFTNSYFISLGLLQIRANTVFFQTGFRRLIVGRTNLTFINIKK
ncbi:MAG: hypothetical protein ACFE7I_09985, partial [Candidatus Hodarchaeota archaeon]